MFKYLDSASTFTFANSIFLFIVSEFVNLFINSITFSLLSDTPYKKPGCAPTFLPDS